MTSPMTDKPTEVPATFTTEIIWRRPEQETPPFNERILVSLGSWRDRGQGFKPHSLISHLLIMMYDANSDEDEGAAMYHELESGESKWDDLQFQLLDDDDEPLDFYSDSIMWWAYPPKLPDNRKES